MLLHSRQWASIIYSLCVLLAALDVPNAIKQRSNCRIALVSVNRAECGPAGHAATVLRLRPAAALTRSLTAPSPRLSLVAQSLIVIVVCMLVAFIYGAANLQADSDVGCSDADNVATCQSVNSASGAILIIIGIAEAIATGTIIFALPAIQVFIAEQVPRLGGAFLSCCLPERCSRLAPED